PVERRLRKVATGEITAHELGVDESRAKKRLPGMTRTDDAYTDQLTVVVELEAVRVMHRAILTPDVTTRHTPSPSRPLDSSRCRRVPVSSLRQPRRPRHLQVVRGPCRAPPAERHDWTAQPDRRRRAERDRNAHAGADAVRHRPARPGARAPDTAHR